MDIKHLWMDKNKDRQMYSAIPDYYGDWSILKYNFSIS